MILRAILLLAVLLSPALAADDVIVFAGNPESRVDANGLELKKGDLAKAGQCVVVRRGRRYFWASRDNRKLDRVEAGDFIYYLSPEGSGYVKVVRSPRGGFDYMEHLSSGFVTVTYWGRSADSVTAKP